MSEITTIGLDLAKHVFRVHGIDTQGTTVLRKRLRRGQVLAFFSRIPRCVVGLEACARLTIGRASWVRLGTRCG
jgi:transposase